MSLAWAAPWIGTHRRVRPLRRGSLHGSGVTLVFRAARLPLLPGAARLAAGGYLTGGCGRNRCYLAGKIAIVRSVAADLAEAAFDPQTSGGLLIALPKADVPRETSFTCRPC